MNRLAFPLALATVAPLRLTAVAARSEVFWHRGNGVAERERIRARTARSTVAVPPSFSVSVGRAARHSYRLGLQC